MLLLPNYSIVGNQREHSRFNFIYYSRLVAKFLPLLP